MMFSGDADTSQAMNGDEFHGSQSKVDRYKWTFSGKPGELRYIDKKLLHVDRHAYQRDLKTHQVLALASNWSWAACGALTVSLRPDGSLWVTDGQHRLMAALKRVDIKTLPCLVFEVDSLADEAKAFKEGNGWRKPVTAYEKWRAELVMGDPVTVFCNDLIVASGRVASKSAHSSSVRCLAAFKAAAVKNREVLVRTYPLIHEVCLGKPLNERIFGGLIWLEAHMPEGQSLTQELYRKRVLRVGYDGLSQAADEASRFYTKGGDKQWALGFVEAMNHGCRIRLEIETKSPRK